MNLTEVRVARQGYALLERPGLLEDRGETTFMARPPEAEPLSPTLEDIARFRGYQPGGYNLEDMLMDQAMRRDLRIPSLLEDQLMLPEYEQPGHGYFLRRFHPRQPGAIQSVPPSGQPRTSVGI